MLNLSDAMGNVASSLASGLFLALNKVFGSPLDFLSGKSCSSVCGSTWDFICYIENFCVANLLKMGMVVILAYFVLLLLYLFHKIGIFGCIGRGLCRMIWTCLASYCHAWEYCCTFMCIKLASVKRTRRRRHRRRDLEEELESEEEAKHRYGSSSDSSNDSEKIESRRSKRVSRKRRRSHRGSQTSKTLRPRSHGIRVRSGRVLVYSKHGSSKIVQKERKYRRGRQIRR
ncbi:Protein HAPLESS 2, partial [Cucurbita argyrosperma subsp. sororia]